MRKIPMIFDRENWLWKSNFGTFWHVPTTPVLKIQNLLWFVCRNLSDLFRTWNSITRTAIIVHQDISFKSILVKSFAFLNKRKNRYWLLSGTFLYKLNDRLKIIFTKKFPVQNHKICMHLSTSLVWYLVTRNDKKTVYLGIV